MDDYYRRPRRGSEYLPSSTGYRSFKSHKAGEPLGKGPKKDILVETQYKKAGEHRPSRKPLRFSEFLGEIKDLEKKFGIISVAFLGGSFVFITPNLTGNVIWNLPMGETNLIGISLFVFGLLGLLFCMRRK
jgi:hypothetical protein